MSPTDANTRLTEFFGDGGRCFYPIKQVSEHNIQAVLLEFGLVLVSGPFFGIDVLDVQAIEYLENSESGLKNGDWE